MQRAGISHPRDLPLGPVSINSGTAECLVDRDYTSRVTLQVNGVPSSCIDLDDPGFLAFEYMQQMDAVIDKLLEPGPITALHLGAAACALARCWDSTRPGSRQVAIDIDASLTQLVRQWFDLPRSPQLRLRAQDAVETLQQAKAHMFDVIVRDVFAADTTPPALTTNRAAQQAHTALRPGGIYLLNCADRPPLTLARRELATLAQAFTSHDSALPAEARDPIAAGRLALICEPAVLKGRRYGNLVLVAIKAAHEQTPDASAATLERALRSLPVPVHILTGEALRRFIGTASVLEAA